MKHFVKDKSFYKLLLTIALPIAGQQLITAGVNMMDTLMLGRVSELALSSASMATQVHNMFMFVGLGAGTGGSILFARYVGMKDKEGLRKSITIALRFILILGIIYTIGVALFPEGVMRLLTNDEAIIRESVKYLNWSVPCYILMGLTTVCTFVLRNVGKVKLPLITSIIAFFVNIFFNWVFIFGKLGAPQMGVAGAALGTLIARVVETGIIVVYLFCFEKDLNYRIGDFFKSCAGITGEFFKITVPTIISDILLGLGATMTIAVVGRISLSYMAANSITVVVQNVITIVGMSLSSSCQIIVGNTIGRGEVKEARLESNTFLALGVILGAVVGILIIAFSGLIVDGYKLSAETREVALQLLYAQGAINPIFVFATVITKGVLRAGGDTKFLMVADVVFLWLCSVPLGYLAGVVWGWAPFLIFICLKIDHILKVFLCIFRYKGDKWIKAIKGTLGEQ